MFWPARAAHLAREPELASARVLVITTRQAEAQALTGLLAFQDRRAREAHAAGLDHHTRRAIWDAATGDAAHILGVSEQVASGMLTAARTARATLPVTWNTYLAGVIDTARLRAITTTAGTLIRAAHLEDFDTAAAVAAARMSLGELRAWLRRYTATLDPAQYQADCDRARADRWVRIQHDDHAMSYLEARLPTVAAAAIANRLRAVARGHQHHTIPTPAETDAHCTTGSCTTHTRTTSEAGTTETTEATEATETAETQSPGCQAVQQVLPVEHPPLPLEPPELPPLSDKNEIPLQVQDGPEILPGETPAPGDSDRFEAPPADGAVSRTLAQLEADLFAAWLLEGRVEGAPVEAKIAVMIPETTLTGHSEDPGISADRHWVIPASDARHLAGDPRAAHDWYHATTSPTTRPSAGPSAGPSTGSQPGSGDVSPDILAITSTGRYPPARLRDAIIFRDGTCQAPGCTIPAQRCDLDHRTPYPTGPTSGANLQPLCRRHHRLKSHGLLATEEPPTPPATTAPASQPPDQPPEPSRPRRSQHRPPPLTRLSWTARRAIPRALNSHRRAAPAGPIDLLHTSHRVHIRGHP